MITTATTIPPIAPPLIPDDEDLLFALLTGMFDDDAEAEASALDAIATIFEGVPDSKTHWESEKLPRS